VFSAVKVHQKSNHEHRNDNGNGYETLHQFSAILEDFLLSGDGRYQIVGATCIGPNAWISNNYGSRIEGQSLNCR